MIFFHSSWRVQNLRMAGVSSFDSMALTHAQTDGQALQSCRRCCRVESTAAVKYAHTRWQQPPAPAVLCSLRLAPPFLPLVSQAELAAGCLQEHSELSVSSRAPATAKRSARPNPAHQFATTTLTEIHAAVSSCSSGGSGSGRSNVHVASSLSTPLPSTTETETTAAATAAAGRMRERANLAADGPLPTRCLPPQAASARQHKWGRGKSFRPLIQCRVFRASAPRLERPLVARTEEIEFF